MKLYVAAILVICFLENFKVYLVREAVGSQIMAQSTCVKWYRDKIKLQSIVGYKRLENIPKEAVILITRKGVKVCVLPDHPQLKKIINYLDRKANTRKRKRTTTTPDYSTH